MRNKQSACDKVRKAINRWSVQTGKPNPAFIIIPASLRNEMRLEACKIIGCGIGELHTIDGIILKTPEDVMWLSED